MPTSGVEQPPVECVHSQRIQIKSIVHRNSCADMCLQRAADACCCPTGLLAVLEHRAEAWVHMSRPADTLD